MQLRSYHDSPCVRNARAMHDVDLGDGFKLDTTLSHCIDGFGIMTHHARETLIALMKSAIAESDIDIQRSLVFH